MNTPDGKAKRWQFGLRELFGLMTLVAAPIVLFRIVYSDALELIAIGMGGGVIGGVCFWVFTGTRRGSVYGYVLGFMLTPTVVIRLVRVLVWKMLLDSATDPGPPVMP